MMSFITGQSDDGVPLVWNDGFSVACEGVRSPIEIAGIVRSFIKNVVGGASTFLFGHNSPCCFRCRAPWDETPGKDAQQ
jgi:hypothetical protein